MKRTNYIIPTLSLALFLTSCGRFDFQKRRYEKGFYLNHAEKIRSTEITEKRSSSYSPKQEEEILIEKTDPKNEIGSTTSQQENSKIDRSYFSEEKEDLSTFRDTIPPDKKQEKKKQVQTLNEPTGKGRIGLIGLILILLGIAVYGLSAIPALIILFNFGGWGIFLGLIAAVYSHYNRDKETAGSYTDSKITIRIFFGLLIVMAIALIAFEVVLFTEH